MALVSASLAALIYLLPLQILLYEGRHKRYDMGGYIAALATLVPMWVLLLVAVFAVVDAGAFDDLSLSRFQASVLAVTGLLAMAVVSFMGLETVPRPKRMLGWLLVASLQVFPLLTFALVGAFLRPDWIDPQWAPAIRFTWLGFALACLAICIPWWLVLILRIVMRRTKEVGSRVMGGRGRSARYLAEIARLDPAKDFKTLVGMTNPYYGGRVRDAAAHRLHEAPDAVSRLITELKSGSAENALCAIGRLTLSADDASRLAGPASQAVHRLADEWRAQPRSMPWFYRIVLRFAGGRIIQRAASRFPNAAATFDVARRDFEAAVASTSGARPGNRR